MTIIKIIIVIIVTMVRISLNVYTNRHGMHEWFTDNQGSNAYNSAWSSVRMRRRHARRPSRSRPY